MKCIINYFKRKKEERLRAKIALKGNYGANVLHIVYEFVKGKGKPSKTAPIQSTEDGSLFLKGKMNFDWYSILDDYFKKKESEGLNLNDSITLR